MRVSFPSLLLVSALAHVAIGEAVVHLGKHNATLEPAPVASTPTLAGDTVEVPSLESIVAAAAEEPTVDLDTPAQASAEVGDEPATKAATKPQARRLRVKGAAPSGDAQESSAATEPARYGAVGERSAVDLVAAFKRGFPQATSADRIWETAPIGPAGSFDVVLTIDASGHLASASIEGNGSAALRRGVTQTLALIRGREFTALRPTTRLHVVGTISREALRTDKGADAFGVGTAFFSLSIGRRIDVSITERVR